MQCGLKTYPDFLVQVSVSLAITTCTIGSLANCFVLKFARIRICQGSYFVRVHLADKVTKSKFQQFDCCPFEIVIMDKKAPE